MLNISHSAQGIPSACGQALREERRVAEELRLSPPLSSYYTLNLSTRLVLRRYDI